MDDKTPKRPDGVGEGPRVEVEATPREASSGTANDTARTGQIPYVPSTAAPVTETVKHTVVKTRTKKIPVFLASFAGLAVGAVLVIALVMTGALNVSDTTVQAGETGSSATQHIKIDSEDTTLAEAVSAKALPSVVSITVQTGGTSQGITQQSSQSSGSIGSGVVLDKKGNILTNYHVVEGATAIAVSMGGESYEAELVGSDSSSDLAVIKLKDVDESKLAPIEIGDSDDLTVGEWVMAIGSPFGNEQSVSTGIVSALYRSTAMGSTSGNTIYANMIQTDAAINPGNSGGALVNDAGELIGINSIIESYSGSSSGVGFAIPVNYAKKIADQIIDGKTPTHPYLGVTLSSVNALSNNSNASQGALVASVVDGGPAASAGLEQGDVVTAIDDTDITSADGLIIALRGYDVGDTVTLKVMRDGKEQKVEVELGSDESLQESQSQDSTQGDANGSGMTQEELLEYLRELMGGQNQQ